MYKIIGTKLVNHNAHSDQWINQGGLQGSVDTNPNGCESRQAFSAI